MLFRWIFLLLLPLNVVVGSIIENESDYISKGPAPQWAQPCDYALDTPLKPSEVNLQFLALDLQRHWPEHTAYFHVAIKALTQAGIDQIAQVEMDFAPLFQKCAVHTIQIFRNGVWLDRSNARHELLQREEGLGENLFSGELTLVYFLEDIREGDILEYAYSVIGENPLFTSHFTEELDFELNAPVEKISYKLFTAPEHTFEIKQFNTDMQPEVIDLSDTLREWHWEAVGTKGCADEESQPAWYRMQPHIELSEYRNWREVIEKLGPLFQLSPDLEKDLPEGMGELVQSWKGTSLERACAALRFVQDEVRYLGFEEGIGGHKPHDPCLVFQRRFGDCKDKTVLLKALLHLMGISSTPVLVHSYTGMLIPETLPTPFAFNHVILRIEIDGIEYWVDPTIPLQGGSLANTHFPDYGWGLDLSSDAEGLVQLPLSQLDKPTEIETVFKVISEEEVELSIIWTSFDQKADSYRRYVQWTGINVLSDEALKALKKRYGTATLLAPMQLEDDRENNIVTLKESYLLPIRKKGDRKILRISSIVIRHFLDSYLNPERNAPYSLFYPLWVREHVRVENPLGNWIVDAEDTLFQHDALYYHFTMGIAGQQADFYHELKHLKDHVSAEAIYKYWEIAQEIEENGSIELKVK